MYHSSVFLAKRIYQELFEVFTLYPLGDLKLGTTLMTLLFYTFGGIVLWGMCTEASIRISLRSN